MIRAIALILLLLATCAAGLCQEEAPAGQGDDAEGQVVIIRARWPGHDLANTSFRVFTDQRMRELVDVFPAPEGSAITVLRPGEYYVMAVVDANGNNQVDAGDGFGFHGVTDLSPGAQPAAMTVREGELNAAEIAILMVRAEDGRLVPLPVPEEEQQTFGTIAGSVLGAGGEGREMLLVALPVGGEGRPVAAAIDEDGGFAVRVTSGTHRLVALADGDGTGTLSAGDLVATAGSEEAPITVEADATTTVVPIAVGTDASVPQGIPPLVAGRIIGAAIPEGGRASVAFCIDESLREEAFSVAAGADGRFVAVAEAGTYYIRATIDVAADGQLGPGDMMGFFGVEDLLGGATPAAVEVGEGALRTDLDVTITARIDEDGRLGTFTAAGDAATDAAGTAGE